MNIITANAKLLLLLFEGNNDLRISLIHILLSPNRSFLESLIKKIGPLFFSPRFFFFDT